MNNNNNREITMSPLFIDNYEFLEDVADDDILEIFEKGKVKYRRMMDNYGGIPRVVSPKIIGGMTKCIGNIEGIRKKLEKS